MVDENLAMLSALKDLYTKLGWAEIFLQEAREAGAQAGKGPRKIKRLRSRRGMRRHRAAPDGT